MATARQPEELDAWRLAAELRDEIVPLTRSGPITKDYRFRDQILDSSASGPANLSEGFGKFKPRLFAHSARIALGSLRETKNHLEDGCTKGYFTEQDTTRLVRLANRAIGATTNLLRYLDSCKGVAPTGWDFD